MISRTKGKHKRAYSALVALFGLLLFLEGVNLWFFSVDNPLNYDNAGHTYLLALKTLDEDSEEGIAAKISSLYFNTLDNDGPTFQAPLTISLMLFGRDSRVAAGVNTFFLALLLIGTYALGKAMFDEHTGLVAACLLSTYPVILSLSRGILSRLSLAAMVIWFLWALVRSDRFSSRRYSLIAGLLLGMAAMTKPQFSLFLIGPFLAEMILEFLSLLRGRRGVEARRRGMNLGLASIVALLLALPWYVSKLGSYGRTHGLGIILGEIIPLESGYALPLFLRDLVLFLRDLLGTFVFWLFILSSIFLLAKGRWRAFLWAWIIPPTIVFFIFGGRHAACLYQGIDFAGMLPAVALICAFGTVHARDFLTGRWTRCKRWLPGLLAAAIILSHFLIAAGVNLSTRGGIPGLKGPSFLRWARFGCYGGGTCNGDTCLELDQLNNRAPSSFSFEMERLVIILAERESALRILYFHRQGPFSSLLHDKLNEREILVGNPSAEDSACVDTPAVRVNSTAGESTPRCAETLLAADVFVLEKSLSDFPCDGSLLQQAWNEVLSTAEGLTESFEVAYAVWAIPTRGADGPPASVVYLRDDGLTPLSALEMTLENRQANLLAVVLLRREAGTPPSDIDLRILRQLKGEACESTAATETPYPE